MARASSLLGRLRGAVLRAAFAFSPGSTDAVANMLFPPWRGGPRLGAPQMLQAYSTMPWLRAFTDKIAHDVGATTWQVFLPTSGTPKRGVRDLVCQRGSLAARTKTLTRYEKQGDLREIANHPVLDFLTSGSQWFPGNVATGLTQTHLDLVGEMATLMAVNEQGMPVRGVPIPPTWIIAMPQDTGGFYRVMGPTGTWDVPEDMMLWAYHPDPANPFLRGCGIAQVLGDELETDEHAAKYTKDWFRNRAIPPVLISGLGINLPELQRLEERWLAKFQKSGAGWLPQFLAKDVKVHQLSQTFEQQQLGDLRTRERDMIRQVFGIPPEIIGDVSSSNRSTIDVADFIYQSRVIVPRLEFLRAQLQERLMGRYDERLVLSYVSPVQEDREFALKVRQAASYAWTVDEWRALGGSDPLPAKRGQVHVLAANLVPTDLAIPEPAPPPDPALPLPPAPDPKAPVKLLAAPVVKITLPSLAPILAAITPTALQARTRRIISEAVTSFGQRTLDSISDGGSFTITDPAVAAYLEEFGAQMIDVNETTRARIRAAVQAGLDVGEGTEEIADRIRGVFGAAGDARAMSIARTEIGRASNFAALEGIRQAGLEQKEWLATQDNVTRDTHRELDGQVVGVDEDFTVPVSGETTDYPGNFGVPELDINCRCGVLPVFGDGRAYASPVVRAAHWKSLEADRAPHIRVMRVALQAAFRQQEAAALEALAKHAKAATADRRAVVMGRRARFAELFARRAAPVEAAITRRERHCALMAKYSPDQPRVPAGSPDGGQFGAGGGGGSASGGGDSEHTRLGSEAAVGAAALDRLLPGAIENADFNDAGTTAESFDDLESGAQSEIKNAYIDEVLNDGVDTGLDVSAVFSDNADWEELESSTAADFVAAVAAHTFPDETVSPPLPGMPDLSHGLHLDPDTVALEHFGGADPSLDVDYEGLRTVDGRPLTASEQSAAAKIFNKLAPAKVAEAVDHFSESDTWNEIRSEAEGEAALSSWNSLGGAEALDWAKAHGHAQVATRVAPGAPSTWQWDNTAEGSGQKAEDYQRSQAVVKALVSARTAELLAERGLTPPLGGVDTFNQVWSEWKTSSASPIGQAFQVALRKELGGLDRLTAAETADAERAADNRFFGVNDTVAGGPQAGMGRLQAYARAQWEATQWLLGKAKVDSVETYRAVFLPKSETDATRHEDVTFGEGARAATLTRLPDVSIKRNGASSATLSESVANNWDGVGKLPKEAQRVVIRLKVPATSVVSVPVFGQNEHGEHEVVLAGTKEKWTWDAWLHKAPTFSVPIHGHKGATMTRGKRLGIDLKTADAGPHWLSAGPPRDAGGKPVLPDPPVKAAPRAKFSPDQPRVPAGSPDGGQFGPGGGAGGGAGSSTGHGDGGVPVAYSTDPATWDLKADGDTQAKFVKDGAYTPERAALHDAITAEYLRDVPVSEHPTVYMLGGGPATGKSRLASDPALGFPAGGAAVNLDSDALKLRLPEYGLAKLAGNWQAARLVHEESSDLSKRILAEAASNRHDIVFDGTGDSSIDNLAAKVGRMRAAGAEQVVASYATTSVETALAREAARRERTGRAVPEEVLRNTHAAISRIFPDAVARGLFDKVDLWDTTGKAPVHVVSGGKGLALTIHDQPRWDAFLAKGHVKATKADAAPEDDPEPLDVPTLNAILLAVLVEDSPADAGLPDTPQVQEAWDSILADCQQAQRDGLVVPMVEDLPEEDAPAAAPEPDRALSAEQATLVAGWPESGMGYQALVATLADGREIAVQVLNGAVVDGLPDGVGAAGIVALRQAKQQRKRASRRRAPGRRRGES